MSAAAAGSMERSCEPLLPFWDPLFFITSAQSRKPSPSPSVLSPAATPRQWLTMPLRPPQTPPAFKDQSDGQREHLMTAADEKVPITLFPSYSF